MDSLVIEKPRGKSGRKYDLRKDFYTDKFKLTACHWRTLTFSLLNRLDACKDDDARRLILGISEKA